MAEKAKPSENDNHTNEFLLKLNSDRNSDRMSGYFMKLGHLLTLYVEASGLQQRLLQSYLGGHVDATKLVLRKSTNFYVEAFFAIKPLGGRDTFWPYLLVTTIIVSLAQATALYLVGQAFGLNRWLPCVVLVSGACGISYVVLSLSGAWQRSHYSGTLCVVR
jgi:hypothetical protein